MSVKAILKAAACVAVLAAVTVFLFRNPWRNARPETWNKTAMSASLERVVPAHNDLSFIYVLENRTDSDYRIAADSEVEMFRRRFQGGPVTRVAEHLSGEFPLWVPARRKVHFALVWTADADIDPGRIGDFVNSLDVGSFVLFDSRHGYQIEFPVQ